MAVPSCICWALRGVFGGPLAWIVRVRISARRSKRGLSDRYEPYLSISIPQPSMIDAHYPSNPPVDDLLLLSHAAFSCFDADHFDVNIQLINLCCILSASIIKIVCQTHSINTARFNNEGRNGPDRQRGEQSSQLTTWPRLLW